MPFGLPPVWPQALKQPFPNRNFSFLLFLFLRAMAIQGFFFAHFLPKTGLPVWGSYSFERVAFLGRMILFLSPGLRSWYALRLRSGCSGPPGRTLLHLSRACLPLTCMILHLSPICLPCVSHLPLTVSEYAMDAPAAWFYICRMMCLMAVQISVHTV